MSAASASRKPGAVEAVVVVEEHLRLMDLVRSVQREGPARDWDSDR
jgi:hypothetical protein